MKVSLERFHKTLLICPLTVYDLVGERPRKLLAAVDTGASSVMIPVDVARALGYSLADTETQALVTGAGVIYAPKIVLRRVDVGSVSATQVEAICHDLPEEALVDALVGLSFLTCFDVRFDFSAWEMELTPRR